jgi:hypothetical protein
MANKGDNTIESAAIYRRRRAELNKFIPTSLNNIIKWNLITYISM